jgi:hypothetical protein
MLVDSSMDADDDISRDDGDTGDVENVHATDHESPNDSMDADDNFSGDDGSTDSDSSNDGMHADDHISGDAHVTDHGSPNVSLTLSSVEGTVDHDSRRPITDFAILLETVINHDFHWVDDQWEDSVDVIMPEPGPDAFSADIAEWILSVVEIKPLPSRSLTEEEQMEERGAKMTQAQVDIRVQVGSLMDNFFVSSLIYLYRPHIYSLIDAG